ncbi:hypothetical protein [uncultured Oscillibacter sp.]|uniref:hypothetical protein n=1 Tax=uncultured Oscillibacter sp. TaxID=876091 RepID=UPI0025F1EB2B|nr:hypothetical protein [uncultured Oscillibacter sp.]
MRKIDEDKIVREFLESIKPPQPEKMYSGGGGEFGLVIIGFVIMAIIYILAN